MYTKLLHVILVVSIVLPIEYCAAGVFYIGAAFDHNKKLNSAILDYAIETANKNVLSDSDLELRQTVELLEYGNEFMAADGLCRLLEAMNLAIIGPKSPQSSTHLSNICDAKEIPYIDTYMNTEPKSSNVNLYPSQDMLAQMLIDVVNASKWEDFTILYEAPMYIKRLTPLLAEWNNRGVVTVQPIETGTNYRSILKRLKDINDQSNNFIIECSIEHLSEILEQALQVGLFSKDRSFIITNLDAHTINLEPYQYSEAEVKLFRVINQEVPYQEYVNIRDVLDKEKQKCEDFNNCTPEDIEELSPEILQASTALIYDATMILAQALKQIGFAHLQDSIQRIRCFDAQSTWSKGYTITNFMKNSNYTGLSGQIEFDTKGMRSNVEIDVMALKTRGLVKAGSYKPANIPRLTEIDTEEKVIDNGDVPIDEKTFIVITSLSDPYAMEKEVADGLKGNDRYEGFGIDIIDELSKLYGFKYEFVLQTDGNNGKVIDPETNTWDGMIGEVQAGRADLAITDLTINSDRITALDFTPSFLNLGIALLYRKPMQEPPSTFSFMSPFSSIVWIYLGAAYITVSLCFFCLGRISPSQWENRYPCIEEPTHLENQFTLNNSMWFAIGALLQQGSEIEPKAASIRLASSVWWFFTLIMVSSYTANLAAFLVVENKVPKINGVEDLKDCGIEGKECPVKFGAKGGGATMAFFRNSSNPNYQQMYKYMMANPDLLPESNEKGVERVYKGEEDYAFLMESSSMEFATERKCNLTQVGGRLDDKNYGIGMRKNWQYQAELSEGILRLQEKGILAELHTKWWKERKGGGRCSDEDDDGQAVPLQLANVIGIFYVLIGGSLFAVLYAIFSLLANIYHRTLKYKKDDDKDAEELKMDNLRGVFWVLLFGSIFACIYGCSESLILTYRKATAEKISFKEEFMAEMRFLMTCPSIKQVRHRKNSSKSQESSTRSNASRYSQNTHSQIHGSNALLNLD